MQINLSFIYIIIIIIKPSSISNLLKLHHSGKIFLLECFFLTCFFFQPIDFFYIIIIVTITIIIIFGAILFLFAENHLNLDLLLFVSSLSLTEHPV